MQRIMLDVSVIWLADKGYDVSGYRGDTIDGLDPLGVYVTALSLADMYNSDKEVWRGLREYVQAMRYTIISVALDWCYQKGYGTESPLTTTNLDLIYAGVRMLYHLDEVHTNTYKENNNEPNP